MTLLTLSGKRSVMSCHVDMTDSLNRVFKKLAGFIMGDQSVDMDRCRQIDQNPRSTIVIIDDISAGH
ncbi:hypothetical protein, partial [Vibrio anguillarum]|uniref:hypothetical protein n=1 Tax=Vibrio anguillarum TaxID=55601 RepID=UPI001BE4A9A5